MKNSPDQSEFHELVKRLQSYTEEPDELAWKNIDAALRPNRTSVWFPWLDGVTGFIAVLTFAFLFADVSSDHESDRVANSKKNNAIAAPDKNKFSPQQHEMKEDTRPGAEGQENAPRLFVVQADPQNRQGNQELFKLQTQTVQGFDSAYQSEKSDLLNDVPPVDSIFTASSHMEADSGSQSSAEVRETKRLRKRKITLYAHLTPMLSFQRATPASRDGVVVTALTNRSILSAERFAVSLDAGVQGFIAKRFEYYGGLSLYRQNQTLRYTYQLEGQANVESTGDKSYTVTPKSSTGIVRYNMLNVGVNAGVLYSLYGRKLVHKIGTGISYQRGFGKSDSEVYKNAESNYLAYQVFYRNEVSVSGRLRVYIQPTFTHAVRVQEALDAPFTLKPYSAGIGFGILYVF